MADRNIKQVIIIRKDLRNKKGEKVRTGKLIAQGAHASSKIFLDRIEVLDNGEFKINITQNMLDWIKSDYTKVCLAVNSEEELLNIYNKALESDIPAVLITDNGYTEFLEPTNTCVALGADSSDKIDNITRHLRLY